ncbi:nitroreductase [Levilactobacillus acidifarinae]|nr:nitroreductase [Levilactobacillus acidifarinae]GEO70103.1 nitrobenzoate reductase [Levilactobacillus acidifarinae]
MDFSEVLKHRVSIRDYQPTQVTRTLLTSVVADAQQAPSWANSQPWKVYIATGETMKKIQKSHLEKTRAGIKGNADLPVKDIHDWGNLPWSNMSEWLDKVGSDPTMTDFTAANGRLWNAPAMAYITIPKTAPVWSIYDAGSFAQTLMLSAASHGLDTMVAYENVKYADEIREFAGVPADELIVEGIAMGYRSDDKINDFKNARLATAKMLTIL